ncbi:MAG: hypothetical protein QT09_C0012G0056 [archaeon GW2011_AR18]|nr:MAG: hypothetical protein QT09_C0012G0056 [archaeon GW2011_AR18]
MTPSQIFLFILVILIVLSPIIMIIIEELDIKGKIEL